MVGTAGAPGGERLPAIGASESGPFGLPGGAVERAARGRGRRSTATSGASSGAGERRTSRSAAHARSGIRLYPEMQSAHACMTGRRFSSRSSRA